MRVCLFEDRAERLEPLALTRPVFDLRCGMVTLGQKLLRHLGASSWGALVRPELEELVRLEHPACSVNDADWLAADDLLLVNGRWLPPEEMLLPPTESCVGMTGGGVAFIFLKQGQVAALGFEQLSLMVEVWQQTLPNRAVGGHLIGYAWDLVEHNGAEIRRDFSWLPILEPGRDEGHAVLGPRGQVWIAPTARVEPMVVIDASAGPVVIDAGAVVSAFTRLEGPCYVGRGTQVFGAKIRAGTSLGPHCRVGGEVEASIIHGHSNKYHDGFLGHSYIGTWVNLGAGTHNSDLRNDYGEVTMILHGLPVHTGMSKLGCFIGDHTKTGLGTLFNTGTNVGPFCGLLPAGRFAPKYVPPFTSWWNGNLREAFPFDSLLATAEIAMKRRGVTLTDTHRKLYAWLLDATDAERRHALRESEQRQLRRSA